MVQIQQQSNFFLGKNVTNHLYSQVFEHQENSEHITEK